MGEPGQGAAIASKTLFTAASAANAIPVAGQFVSAGLAIAGLFAKIFGGRRRKKKAEAEARKKQQALEERSMLTKAKGTGIQGAAAVGGQQAQQSLQATAPVTNPQTSSFNSWGGGSAPPVQQVINSKIGL